MRIDPSLNYAEGFLKIEQDKNLDTAKFQEILNKAQKEQHDDKLKEVCQQLESVFVHQMITQMRSSIPKDGYLQSGQGEKIFQDMLDREYAQKISQSGGLGLADMLYQQLAYKIKK